MISAHVEGLHLGLVDVWDAADGDARQAGVDLCQCDESLGGVPRNLPAAHPGVQILRELEQGETLTYAGLGDPQALGDALDRQAVLAQPVIGAGATEGVKV